MTDTVSLVEITEKNLSDILKLKVAPAQESFVASNAVSIAQAHFNKAAWFRAIQAEEKFVGFAMLFDPSQPGFEGTEEEHADIWLWRFMIDERYQKNGYGVEALRLICAHTKTRPSFERLLASYVDAPGGPEEFYLNYGFEKTGKIEDGEVVISIDL